MALQFNPPNIPLEQPENSVDKMNKTFEMLNAYAQQRQQRQYQQQVLASLDAQRKANEFKSVADYVPEAQIPALARNYGISIPPADVPPTPSSGTATSPIINHFNSLGNRPTSKHGLDKYKENIGLTKTEGDMAPKTPITKEALLESGGKFDPMSQMIVEPPAPKPDGTEKLSDKQLKDAQDAYNRDDNVKKAQAVVDKVGQAVPLLKAGSVDNATAKQALQTAMTYMATGGMRVNEVELRQFGGANAMTNKMGQWYKGLDAGTLTERDAKDMGKVLEIFQKSAQSNLQNGGLRHARQYLQRSRSGEAEPEAYKRVTGIDFMPAEVHGDTGPHGPSVNQNGHTYNWNPQTKQYE